MVRVGVSAPVMASFLGLVIWALFQQRLRTCGRLPGGPDLRPGDDSVIAGMPRIWSHLKFIVACPLSQAGSPIKTC